MKKCNTPLFHRLMALLLCHSAGRDADARPGGEYSCHIRHRGIGRHHTPGLPRRQLSQGIQSHEI